MIKRLTKKKIIKKAVDKGIRKYYESGLTNTADKVRQAIWKELDRLWK